MMSMSSIVDEVVSVYTFVALVEGRGWLPVSEVENAADDDFRRQKMEEKLRKGEGGRRSVGFFKKQTRKMV